MATPQFIPPFPENIDRIYFGGWFSGLTAGEACFTLKWEKRKYATTGSARFEINLRQDDRGVLELVQSFLGCGILHDDDRNCRPNEKPTTRFLVAKLEDLTRIVIPHFDACPILAKKVRDFVIWREGVFMLMSIKQRRRGHRSGGIDRHRTWTDQDRVTFGAMIDAIKNQRLYQSPVIEPPKPTNGPRLKQLPMPWDRD